MHKLINVHEFKTYGAIVQTDIPSDAKLKQRRWLRWLYYAVTGLLILAVIFSLLVWFNRVSIVETLLNRAIDARGFSGDVTVTEVGSNKAVAEDVSLTDTGGNTVRIESIDVRFDWRKLRRGDVDLITVIGPSVIYDISDGKGLPDFGGGSGGGIVWPSDGVTFEGGDYKVITDWGTFSGVFEAALPKQNEWTANLALDDMDIRMRDRAARSFGGQMQLRRKDTGDTDAVLNIYAAEARPMDGTLLTSLNMAGAVTLRPDRLDITDMDMTLKNAVTPDMRLQDIAVKLSGTLALDMESRAIGDGQFDIDFASDAAGFTNADRREGLASNIIAHNALSSAPVVREFADPLLADIEGLFAPLQTKTMARVSLARSGDITLQQTGPIERGTRGGRELAFENLKYRFQKAGQTLELSGDVKLQGRYPVSLTDMHFAASSDNGISINRVETIESQISLPKNWTRSGGRRLSASLFNFKYGATETGSTVDIAGPLRWSGPFILGDAEDLRVPLNLRISSSGGTMAIAWNARQAVPVEVDHFRLDNGIIVNNLTSSLAPGRFLVSRGDTRSLDQVFSGVAANVVQPDGTAFDVVFADGDFTARFSSVQSRIDLTMASAILKSEKLFGHPANIQTQAGTLHADFSQPQIQYELRLTDAGGALGGADIAPGPVTVTGRGLDAKVAFNSPQVNANRAGIPAVPMRGKLDYSGGILYADVSAKLPGATGNEVGISARIDGDTGAATLTTRDLIFSPAGLTPFYFRPTLRGLIADVSGAMSAEVQLDWQGDDLTSNASVDLKAFDFGNKVGPVEGLNADLKFSSLLPLKTNGVQTIYIDTFDPGLPFDDGVINLAIDGSIANVESAVWPFAGGEIAIENTRWNVGAERNDVTLLVRELDLNAVAELVASERLVVSGSVSGELPVIVEGLKVRVKDGILKAQGAGTVSLREMLPEGTPEQNLETLADTQSIDYQALTFQALEDFQYQELEARLNGALDGEMELGMLIEGQNRRVLGGAPFRFNVTVEGELANILRRTSETLNYNQVVLDQIQAEPTPVELEAY